ncbi:MAG: hypothetical protein VCD31_11275 [Alphaproteobacteria bacterium]
MGRLIPLLSGPFLGRIFLRRANRHSFSFFCPSSFICLFLLVRFVVIAVFFFALAFLFVFVVFFIRRVIIATRIVVIGCGRAIGHFVGGGIDCILDFLGWIDAFPRNFALVSGGRFDGLFDFLARIGRVGLRRQGRFVGFDRRRLDGIGSIECLDSFSGCAVELRGELRRVHILRELQADDGWGGRLGRRKLMRWRRRGGAPPPRATASAVAEMKLVAMARRGILLSHILRAFAASEDIRLN